MLATQRLLLTDREKKLPENLAALSGSSLVGRVVETGAFTARLQLVTDAGFATRAHIGRIIDPQNPREVQAGARILPLTERVNFPVEAYAHGDGAGGLVCDPIPAVHNIRPGDVLQTRGDEALLPTAVVIGRVSDVQNDPEHPGMVIVRAQPPADLASLRDVYVVVPRISQPAEGKGD
jgi:cell shape-determining protein MreC